jgi:hypothetical protein
MFKDNEELMRVGIYLDYLEIESEHSLKDVGNPSSVESLKPHIQTARHDLESWFASKVLGETKSGVRYGEQKAAKSAFYARLTMALFGGFALVVPMLIMTLHQTRLTSLLTTSLFVLVVGVVLAWVMKSAESKDIIGATAAYAAVLVVFVGAATPTSAGG